MKVPSTSGLGFKIPMLDKMVHVIIFIGKGFLFSLSFDRHFKRANIQANAMLVTLVFCTLMGGFTEFVQYYWIPHRDGELKDFIADIFGTVIGLSGFWLWMKLRLTYSQKKIF
ncbi:VanZ family protein [Rapidithrix thailandica]|uniref:VanZ family protein n=1 Tax=Rapidithrix thailandica TaxID=413964 RepID=A0AAW9SBP6_9BACT